MMCILRPEKKLLPLTSLKHSKCRSSFTVNCSFPCLKSDANTALMIIILVGFERWGRFLTWSFIYLYKVQQTLTREWHLLTEWLFPWRKQCIQRAAGSLVAHFLQKPFLHLYSSTPTFSGAQPWARPHARCLNMRAEEWASCSGPYKWQMCCMEMHPQQCTFWMSSLPSLVRKDGPIQLCFFIVINATWIFFSFTFLKCCLSKQIKKYLWKLP